jgi:hypothetical protein
LCGEPFITSAAEWARGITQRARGGLEGDDLAAVDDLLEALDGEVQAAEDVYIADGATAGFRRWRRAHALRDALQAVRRGDTLTAREHLATYEDLM